MHSEIATFDHPHDDVSQVCLKTVDLGVQFISSEFESSIYYEVRHYREERKIAFVLLHVATQHWHSDPAIREIIEYKLRTHFRIVLDIYYNSAD